MIQQIRLVLLIPRGSEMVKETEKFDWKGEFSPHTLPISRGSPKGAMGASSLAGWYKPPTGICHKPCEVTTEP